MLLSHWLLHTCQHCLSSCDVIWQGGVSHTAAHTEQHRSLPRLDSLNVCDNVSFLVCNRIVHPHQPPNSASLCTYHLQMYRCLQQLQRSHPSTPARHRSNSTILQLKVALPCQMPCRGQQAEPTLISEADCGYRDRQCITWCLLHHHRQTRASTECSNQRIWACL